MHLGRCVASVQQPFAENIDKHLTHVLLRAESPSSKSYVLSNKHARLRRPNRGRLSRETSGSLATRLVAHRARLRVPSHSPCLTVSTHGPLYFCTSSPFFEIVRVIIRVTHTKATFECTFSYIFPTVQPNTYRLGVQEFNVLARLLNATRNSDNTIHTIALNKRLFLL